MLRHTGISFPQNASEKKKKKQKKMGKRGFPLDETFMKTMT